MWGLVKDKRLYRLTFSHSLAKLISEKYGFELRQFDAIRGRRLKEGEVSKTGLYGIRSTSSNVLLRCAMFREIADMYRDISRDVVEVSLIDYDRKS